MAHNVLLLFVILLPLCMTADLLVGPTRTYKTPAAAIAALTAGGTMILDDGTYQSVFDVPDTVPGFTIKSASGNPYKCILDGRGGVGSGNKLAWGKGILHARAPGTIIGIGFVNGGGADGVSDGEAGIYAESFATSGVLRVVNCSFDGNENGIFVPSWKTGSPGQNVELIVINSVFSKKVPNGIVADGQGHNVYIQGKSYTSIDCIHYPSKYGNNQKSRALTTSISDTYNKHDQGRCLDIPSGGKLTIRGGVYTSVGATAVSNFFNYGGENADSGVYAPDIDGMTIVAARFNDAVWNARSAVTINFKNTIQQWVQVSPPASLNLIGPITGLVSSAPASTSFTSIPSPVLPPWAQ